VAGGAGAGVLLAQRLDVLGERAAPGGGRLAQPAARDRL